MNNLLLTHDLAITIAELLGAARRVHPHAYEPKVIAELAAKAIAFTVQFAIDRPGSDAAQLRALEQALQAVLQESSPR